MSLHPGEVLVDESVVRLLLRGQRSDSTDLAGLADGPITSAGAGTDNTMWRLGAGLVARFPRTAEKVAPLLKEVTWLPRLAPQLSHPIPAAVHLAGSSPDYPFPWAVLGWIDGQPPSDQSVTDWAVYGADLARFVASLHGADIRGAQPVDDLSWYRGGPLHPMRALVEVNLAGARRLVPDVDWEVLTRRWQEALALPAPTGAPRWLHGDLRPANVVVRQGGLCAVLDFGSLSLGQPDAEHVVAWDLPAEGRAAYRSGLAVEEATWRRAQGWAIALSVGGVCEYWERLPSLAAESAARLRVIAADDGH